MKRDTDIVHYFHQLALYPSGQRFAPSMPKHLRRLHFSAYTQAGSQSIFYANKAANEAEVRIPPDRLQALSLQTSSFKPPHNHAQAPPSPHQTRSLRNMKRSRQLADCRDQNTHLPRTPLQMRHMRPI
jgi:hypothetical protein